MKNAAKVSIKSLGFGAMLLAGVAPALALDGCLPTCDERDARMFALAGTGLATLSGDFVSLSLAVPAGTKGFEVSIFDGDVGGFWDGRPPAETLIPPVTEYTLYADPMADGSVLEPVAEWDQATMVDNGWKLLSIPNNQGVAIPNDVRAESPSGNFFYRLIIRNKNPEIRHINAFKVKAGGGASLSLRPQAFSFTGALRNFPQDAEIVYPKAPNDPNGDTTGYPKLSNTTNDGNWTFYVKVPTGAKSLSVWDGDLDFGDFEAKLLDTDDLDTPNNVLPDWAIGTAATNEGVAKVFSSITGNVIPNRTGAPNDDDRSAVYRRSPNVNYSVCTPGKTVCYSNANPSGNSEWEQFRIDTVGPFDPTKMDHLAPNIPAGVWTVNLNGVDMDNLNAYRVQYEIVTAPPQCPTADPCDLPDPPAPLLPYLVGDTIWLDTNGNGIQDAGEAGIPGVFVQLIDANGLPAGSAVTDGEGKYSFPAENGVYTVKVDASNFTPGGALANYEPTSDYSGDNVGDNERTSSVAGFNNLNYDFGYVNYLVGDTIWLDTNGNGIQDNGEAGLPGVAIKLMDGTGNAIATTTTDGSGKYSFRVTKGSYTVKVDESNFTSGGVLAGYVPTVDYSGDGAGDNERSQSVASANVLTYDFGYTRPASLGDRVWQELQRNGLQDAGEPGMAGVTVTLTGSDGSTKTTQTSSTGNYLFTGLMPGVNYTVRVTAPAGFAFTTPFNWNPANGTDNNADATGNLGTYTLVSGQSLTTVDAGLVQTSCNLSTAQTLTQGGWSNRAHARLLDGLVSQGKIPVRIGNDQNSITLTTRTAVQNFLATGGTPRQLTGGHVTNPTSNIRNTLASQTLTTTLNYLQWSSLGPATLRSGPYAGKSVLEVIYLANQALGSGATSTVYSNLTNALDTINNNLDGGTCNRGNLVCPR